MNLLVLVAVGVGGAFGALCRSKATNFLKPKFVGYFPWPTLLINITSCTLAGAALCAQLMFDPTLYLAFSMGFLGGLSTLSTMNYEAVDLFLNKHVDIGVIYLIASYASTLGAAALGFALVSLFI